MKTWPTLTLLGASWAVFGCGGGSAKHVDASVGGLGGTAGSGSGGVSTGTGGSPSSGVGGSAVKGLGGSTTNGKGGAMTAGTGGTPSTGAGGPGTSVSDASVGDVPVARGTCPQVASAPCGGNVVGTWTLKVDECLFSSPTYCPGLTFSVAPTSNYSVTYSFKADNTLSASISGNFIATIRYPPECLYSDAGATQSCLELSNTLQSVAQQISDAGTDNIMSASYACSADSDGTCACNENVVYTPRTLTGSYTTSGTKLTTLSLGGTGLTDGGPLDGGADGPTDYCVSGNTLTIWPSSSSSNSKITVLTR
jgi:hypothetical protein